MSTQYMPSPFYGHQQTPAGGYGNYPAGKNGGFAFSKRVERVDWRKVAAIDVDTISRTLDFTTLQENIMNITFCNLEAELDIRSVDPNFVKLFKLAQLTIEYLLHSQEYLAGLCSSLEEKSKQSEQEVESVKKELEGLKKELDEVKKESHKRKKLLIAQQQLMYAGNESYNKCPFCAKAFLNNSYLQSHITRRHSAGMNNNKDPSSSALSPDLGVGSENSPNNQLEAELIQIKERLLRQEAELHEERMKNRSGKVVSAHALENGEEGEDLGAGVSSTIMKELRELNAKYQASQSALRELELRTGNKRSNLGDLEDDVENEKEILKEQREELKEQLQEQLDQMNDYMQSKLDKQERKWQKKVHRMTQQHVSEIKKLSSVLESTSRSLDHTSHQRDPHQKQEVEDVLRRSREQEKALEIQEQILEEEISRASEVKVLKSPRRPKGHTPRGTTPRGTTPRGTTPRHDPVIKHSSMYPTDDEDDETAFGTGTSSLKTIGRETGNASTLGQTGTESLHTGQFLEMLRQNPSLAVMREELAALLQEHVEKKGIPPGQTGISDQVLKNKLAMLETQRQGNAQKYLNFMQLRDHFNKVATEKAKKQLRQQTMSPRGAMPPPAGPRRRLDMSPHTPRQQVPSPSRHAGPPHPQQHLSTSRSSSHSPHPRPTPRGGAPTTPSNRPKTPLSTGSTTEWTSTQFDSDEDSEEDDDEESLSRGGPAFKPTPGARLIQSGPARSGPSPRQAQPGPSPRTQQVPKPRVIQSRPLNNNAANDDIDDLLESEGEEPQRNVAGLRSAIEGQLGSRGPGAKPFGGVDVSGGRNSGSHAGNYEEESDWDDTTAPNDAAPAPVAMRRPAARASTDGMSTNTYGTSAWGGSSSKAASTVKDKERRSTSRSSFASVTDVSSDDEMNVDNI